MTCIHTVIVIMSVAAESDVELRDLEFPTCPSAPPTACLYQGVIVESPAPGLAKTFQVRCARENKMVYFGPVTKAVPIT